ADIFLIAIYIVLVKGIGIATVEVAWGLYLFTACILLSMWISYRAGRIQHPPLPEPGR
ncbi:MAG: paraquat-inducible protein A, partial [Paracoccaceae bacterium]